MDHYDTENDYVDILKNPVLNIKNVFLCLAQQLEKRKNKEFKKSKIFIISWDEFENNLNYEFICSNRTFKFFILIDIGSDKFCCLYIDTESNKNNAYYMNTNTDKKLPDNVKDAFLNKCQIEIKDVVSTDFRDENISGIYLIYCIEEVSLKKRVFPNKQLNWLKIFCKNFLPNKNEVNQIFTKLSLKYLQNSNEILTKESDDNNDTQIHVDRNIDFIDTMDLDQRTKESHPKKKDLVNL